MDKSLLSKNIQAFITENLNAEISKLALQKNPFPDTNWLTILNQITSKQKAKTKLPTWFNTENILYPEKISIEQTSSEIASKYKASLISGKNLIDLTGGFGVDDFYFSKNFVNVIHCEINSELSEVVAYNYKQLSANNIDCYSGDSFEILKKLNQKFDWIYIDPSRRNDAKGKVFMLKDCLPNVPELLDFYFSFSENIMIKTAPILDISAGISELKNISKIEIIAVDNEVKELLWILKKERDLIIEINCVNILDNNINKFNIKLNNVVRKSTFSLPNKYIYEPNASIMKSGGFDEVSFQFKLDKLHLHSHLFTSDEVIDFPGRVFLVEQKINYNKSEMKQFLENRKANITTRNFPETVENIRKKWKIKDGGDLYSFFTTDINNNKIVLLCAKI